MSFEEDEDEIRSALDYLKGLDTKGKKDWNKFKGALVAKTLAGLLERHLSSAGNTKLNAFIQEEPTEFDILVLEKNARPVKDYSDIYRKEDVLIIIEVKQTGVFIKYAGNENKAEENIGKYFGKFKLERIPFLYFTFHENRRLAELTKRTLGENNCFFWEIRGDEEPIKGEWERFILRVLELVKPKP